MLKKKSHKPLPVSCSLLQQISLAPVLLFLAGNQSKAQDRDDNVDNVNRKEQIIENEWEVVAATGLRGSKGIGRRERCTSSVLGLCPQPGV